MIFSERENNARRGTPWRSVLARRVRLYGTSRDDATAHRRCRGTTYDKCGSPQIIPGVLYHRRQRQRYRALTASAVSWFSASDYFLSAPLSVRCLHRGPTKDTYIPGCPPGYRERSSRNARRPFFSAAVLRSYEVFKIKGLSRECITVDIKRTNEI